MNIQQKLTTNELACQIIYSYLYILDRFTEEWEQRRGLAKWRLEIFDYVKQANPEDLNYILNYLKKESSVVYLEVSTMLSELTEERKYKLAKDNSNNKLTHFISQFYNNIINWFNLLTQKENGDEKICIGNSIFVGGSCDDDEYPRTNRSIN